MRISLARLTALAAIPVLIALTATSAAARPASGNPPPPKGLEADSASFVTAQTGYVLGARHCSRLPCAARLSRTTNGGKTWSAVTTPAVSLVEPFSAAPASGVDTVRFASASDGWLFGPALWATTDGGAHWKRVSIPGDVVALATGGGEAYAATEAPDGSLLAAKLYRSAVGSSKWALVRGVLPQAALTVSGHSVWAGIAPDLWTSTDSGARWTKLSFACPRSALSASAVAAASTADVAIACSDQGYPQPGFSVKKVYTSVNGGRTFKLVGSPPEPGQVLTLAMPPGRPKILDLAAASGASFLYRSVTGGSAWKQTTFDDGGLSFRDFAFVSASTGYLVHYNGGPVIAYGKGLMKTTNAGASWTTVPIP
jgi:photosystem II stability/assembly factor-like uncharacterized protein